MALRTFNGPGGPIVYDDGQPEERETPILPDPATEPAGIQDPWQAVGGVDAPTRTLTLSPGQDLDGAVAAGTVSDAQADMARQGLAGVVGDAPAPPPLSVAAPTPPAEDPNAPRITQDSNFKEVIVDPMSGSTDLGKPTREEAQAEAIAQDQQVRDAKRAALEGRWDQLDDAALKITDPVLRQQIAAEQGVIADQAKELANEESLIAGKDAAAAQERVKAEAAQAFAAREAEIAQRAADLAADRQKAEAARARLEEQAMRPVDRSLGLSTGQSIMLAISVAIAGFGSALKGQGDKNPALDILMRSIDKNVEDQWARKKELWAAADRIAQGMGDFDNKGVILEKLK